MPVINTLKDIPVFKKLKKRTDLALILNVYILVFSKIKIFSSNNKVYISAIYQEREKFRKKVKK